MDTSSETESYDRTRVHRRRGREAHHRPGRDRGRAGGSEPRPADISEKISTLASTLQDTSRNLTKVDRMLGHYREHTDDQAEAMTLLRDNLEESISQLQTQRVSRTNGAPSASASASTLHTSDLEAGSESDDQRFFPTSPLKDYTSTPDRTRRSQSAGVRFKDASLPGEDIHVLHQSLRDLHCGQLRLSDDLDREILRRNRADIDTRRAMESLTELTPASPRQASVSSRVERRLQELEREMHCGQGGVERERRPKQRVAVSDELHEVILRKEDTSNTTFAPADLKDRVNSTLYFIDGMTWPEVLHAYCESDREYHHVLPYQEVDEYPYGPLESKIKVLQFLVDQFLTTNIARDELLLR
ncbi:hypothetical protein JOQ06_004548 [Pogonophryne albipinna]|uniref:Uncharacterized protein n=1 Tax=Pogonophryne albipinna TaxID=1090488 RepID=A0AAD6AQA1_9TELE|nr:hypothetical protein JOQ06_004548 [Pogonophryne albipinna]